MRDFAELLKNKAKEGADVWSYYLYAVDLVKKQKNNNLSETDKRNILTFRIADADQAKKSFALDDITADEKSALNDAALHLNLGNYGNKFREAITSSKEVTLESLINLYALYKAARKENTDNFNQHSEHFSTLWREIGEEPKFDTRKIDEAYELLMMGLLSNPAAVNAKAFSDFRLAMDSINKAYEKFRAAVKSGKNVQEYYSTMQTTFAEAIDRVKNIDGIKLGAGLDLEKALGNLVMSPEKAEIEYKKEQAILYESVLSVMSHAIRDRDAIGASEAFKNLHKIYDETKKMCDAKRDSKDTLAFEKYLAERKCPTPKDKEKEVKKFVAEQYRDTYEKLLEAIEKNDHTQISQLYGTLKSISQLVHEVFDKEKDLHESGTFEMYLAEKKVPTVKAIGEFLEFKAEVIQQLSSLGRQKEPPKILTQGFDVLREVGKKGPKANKATFIGNAAEKIMHATTPQEIHSELSALSRGNSDLVATVKRKVGIGVEQKLLSRANELCKSYEVATPIDTAKAAKIEQSGKSAFFTRP